LNALNESNALNGTRELSEVEIDEVGGAGGWQDGAIGGVWGGATAQAMGGDARTVGPGCRRRFRSWLLLGRAEQRGRSQRSRRHLRLRHVDSLSITV